MRERSDLHTFSDNLETRRRRFESELAKIPNAATRERLVQQIKEVEAARNMVGWLRSTQLRPPE